MDRQLHCGGGRLIRQALTALVATVFGASAFAEGCGNDGVAVQVLGSGGPELTAGRASSGYLVWVEGRPRVLVDAGGGVMLRFAEAGARVADLNAILFTQLHADHSADFPALVKAASFEARTQVLPVYGPAGSRHMPATVAFVRDLFDPARGAYRYLGDYLSPLSKTAWKLAPHDVRSKPPRLPVGRKPADGEPIPVFRNEYLAVSAIPVAHSDAPALAWRIETGGKSVVFSGDTSGAGDALARLARGADVLIASHAVAEDAGEAERLLHMPPSRIGEIARTAQVRQVVLSHRTRRTFGREEDSAAQVRRHYGGPVAFANDLDCFRP
jgi:ribonuclease BN (tRNA processing enzyme)